MTEAILALDLGTTNIKCLLFGRDGQVLGQAAAAVKTLNPEQGHYEQDPAEILNLTRKLLEELNFVRQPACLVISGAMHSLLAVDSMGKHLMPAILWSDLRSAELATRLKQSEKGSDLHRATGTPVHPMSPLCKLMWMREHRPVLFEQAHKFISIKEYLIYNLTGQYLIDQSLASATGLMDLQNKKWSSTALELIPMNEERLAELQPPGYAIPIVSGRLQGIPLVLGGGDGCLANLGGGVLDNTKVSLTIGTSAALRTTIKEPLVNPDLRTFSYYLDDERYIVGGATNNGGNVIPWLAEHYKATESEIANTPPGSGGLTTLPYVFGERAPLWQTGMEVKIHGPTARRTDAEIARSFIEGISFNLLAIGESIGDFDRIIASGGFINSSFWPQMIADVFNKQVEILRTSENTALGAAFVAMKSLGIITQYEEVMDLIETGTRYIPDPKRHEIHLDSYSVFRSLLDEVSRSVGK